MKILLHAKTKIHQEMMIAQLSPQPRTIIYHPNGGFGSKNIFLSIPYIIFRCIFHCTSSINYRTGFRVFFAKEPFTTTTQLYHVPLPNIGVDGDICVRSTDGTEDVKDLFKRSIHYFWMTGFTGSWQPSYNKFSIITLEEWDFFSRCYNDYWKKLPLVKCSREKIVRI